MKSNRVMLRVEEFRAIGKAEIKLDGITVVAGVNGCGKSTLSKLLYWGFKVPLDFETYVKINYMNPDPNYIKIVGHFKELLTITDESDISKYLLKSFLSLDIEGLNKLRDEIMNNSYQIDKDKITRFWDICYEELSILDNEIIAELNRINRSSNYNTIINFLIFLIEWRDKKRVTDLTIKPKSYFIKKIENVFKIGEVDSLFKKLDICEKDVNIISLEQENMMTPFEIDNVIYIDTPMFFGHTEEEHWKDANEKLKQRPKLNEKPKPIQEIDDLIKRQIFRNGAEVKFDELSESFTFRTSSGVEMDLSDSATGMKTFAVLDRLVKNGSINKKTLLILDEPEAHLHPQWIVELGRLLTLINKHIGAKIFVATHSPDMVQALRYIPNKEGTGENVNFYLAEFNQENGLFDYKDLNGKVGEIFTSFNKSLDKLEEYGDEA